MKVLHISYGYFPDVPGGTEVYVAALVRELAERGTTSVIAAPTSAAVDSSYTADGIPVHRLAMTPEPRPIPSLYGEGDPRLATAMMQVVAIERPDVVHFHCYTPGINGAVARRVREAGIPIVVTYHTPSVTCQRGTLLRFGHIVCDGRMIEGRCAACVVQQHGVPRPIADIVGRMPNVVGRAVASRGLEGGAWTALRMPELMRLRHADTRAFFAAANVVVATAEWVRALLVDNGVDTGKIVLCRQGIRDEEPGRGPSALQPTEGRPLRAVMLGRIDEMKGMHLPLSALERDPDLEIALDIHGGVQSENAYVADLRARIARDGRVRLLPTVRPGDVVRILSDHDVMLVPSQVIETGPLVVLEAQAARVPVIGTALGGISERVRDGIDGRLVELGSVDAWRRALREVCENRALVERWRSAIPAPRTMGRVAEEMAAIYDAIAAGHTAARGAS